MPDSLKFTTPGGRIVYGGGGIMPDIFIPVDTTGISDYFLRVRNSGIIYRYSLRYTEDNRDRLMAFKTVNDLEKFLDSQSLSDKFIAYAESNGIKRDNEGVKISGGLILTQVKAYIARNILDNQGFYPIWEDLDSTLKKAIEYLSSDPKLQASGQTEKEQIPSGG
jgi:carboxyl-terminal processing protease